MTKEVKVGDKAPDFELPDQYGMMFKLSDLFGKKVQVVYFYPKDNTPGCTKEACAFRDRYEAFKELGAEVVGISGDNMASHEKFALQYSLNFRILSDINDVVRKRYGATSVIGPGRVTYVIDKDDVVRHVFSSQMQAARHIDEAFLIVEELAKA